MATLLHYPLCAFSRSIRLALAECGIEAELAEERPWEWRREFVALNPAGILRVHLLRAGRSPFFLLKGHSYSHAGVHRALNRIAK